MAGVIWAADHGHPSPSFQMRMTAFPRAGLAAACLFLLAGMLALDVRAQAVVATVPAGTEARAVAVNANTGRVFVANEFSNDVTVIDGATRTTTRVAVGKRPQYIAVNTRSNKVYVSNAQDASISV